MRCQVPGQRHHLLSADRKMPNAFWPMQPCKQDANVCELRRRPNRSVLLPHIYSHFAHVSDRHYLFVMGEPLNLHDAAYVLGGRVGMSETHCRRLET